MMLTGSEIICECLIEQGVDTVFGYPGGTILNVYDALYRYQDKINHVHFHTTYIDGVPTFEEARLVFIVEKIYEDDIKPENFKDTSLDTKWYPDQDYHRVYIAKIKGVYVQRT